MKAKTSTWLLLVVVVMILSLVPEHSCAQCNSKVYGKVNYICTNLRGFIFEHERNVVRVVVRDNAQKYYYYRGELVDGNGRLNILAGARVKNLTGAEFAKAKVIDYVASTSNYLRRNVVITYGDGRRVVKKREGGNETNDYHYPDKVVISIAHLHLADDVADRKKFEYYYFQAADVIAHVRWNEEKGNYESLLYTVIFVQGSKRILVTPKMPENRLAYNFKLYQRGFAINSQLTLVRKRYSEQERELDKGAVIQFDMNIVDEEQELISSDFGEFFHAVKKAKPTASKHPPKHAKDSKGSDPSVPAAPETLPPSPVPGNPPAQPKPPAQPNTPKRGRRPKPAARKDVVSASGVATDATKVPLMYSVAAVLIIIIIVLLCHQCRARRRKAVNSELSERNNTTVEESRTATVKSSRAGSKMANLLHVYKTKRPEAKTSIGWRSKSDSSFKASPNSVSLLNKAKRTAMITQSQRSRQLVSKQQQQQQQQQESVLPSAAFSELHPTSVDIQSIIPEARKK